MKAMCIVVKISFILDKSRNCDDIDKTPSELNWPLDALVELLMSWWKEGTLNFERVFLAPVNFLGKVMT